MPAVAPSTAVKLAKGTFLKEVKTQKGSEQNLLGLLAQSVNSEHESEDYSWVGESPRLDLLEDELRTENLSDATYSVENLTYAVGINVKRKDLTTDKLGGIMMRVRGMVRVAKAHGSRLLIEALEAATTTTGYDATAVYANAHPDRGAGQTQDNLLAGSGLTVSNAQTDLTTGIRTIAEFLAENGDPRLDGVGRFAVVAPWALRDVFLTAINATMISNTSNVGFADLDIVPRFSARLTDADDWYLLHLGGPLLPIIYQEWERLTFESLAEGSDQWIHKELATFKVRWSGAVGHGHWADQVKFVN